MPYYFRSLTHVPSLYLYVIFWFDQTKSFSKFLWLQPILKIFGDQNARYYCAILLTVWLCPNSHNNNTVKQLLCLATYTIISCNLIGISWCFCDELVWVMFCFWTLFNHSYGTAWSILFTLWNILKGEDLANLVKFSCIRITVGLQCIILLW
jgi:hypothetical protein